MKSENVHTPAVRRLPPWMRKKARETEAVVRLKKVLRDNHLHTVCQSAGCPNLHECFAKPTATFMIMGSTCTRNCRFCGVHQGKPEPVDPLEPGRIAESVRAMQLRHAVITSVTRDDLADGGAGHFARVVRAVLETCPGTTVETLIPDFKGSGEDLRTVIDSGIDILNHNVETVPRLYDAVRPEADFDRSLQVLKRAGDIRPGITVKSGIMVGLGETEAEVRDLFSSLAAVKCGALTIGQYLAPARGSYPVKEYIHPDMFAAYEDAARQAGIPWVYAGPYVRSSYNAETLMTAILEERHA